MTISIVGKKRIPVSLRIRAKMCFHYKKTLQFLLFCLFYLAKYLGSWAQAKVNLCQSKTVAPANTQKFISSGQTMHSYCQLILACNTPGLYLLQMGIAPCTVMENQHNPLLCSGTKSSTQTVECWKGKGLPSWVAWKLMQISLSLVPRPCLAFSH